MNSPGALKLSVIAFFPCKIKNTPPQANESKITKACRAAVAHGVEEFTGSLDAMQAEIHKDVR
jgi:hypothetical protein